jgi:SAM-dependent methyltransferase
VRLERDGLIGRRVLDLGCGTGELALFLAQQGYEVLGLDGVRAAIRRAQAKAQGRKSKARFRYGNALAFRVPGRFDTLVDSGLFHIFRDRDQRRYLACAARALKPGGKLCILCFSDRSPGDFPPRRMTRRELEAAFKPPWRILRLRRTRFHRLGMPAAHAWMLVARLGKSIR